MKTQATKQNPATIVASLEKAYGLKVLPRSGWLQARIPAEGVESIASHSYGMSLLLLYLAPELSEQGLDVDRALRMALIHDLAESITGDRTPEDGVSPMDKYAEESAALDHILFEMDNRSELRDLWEEFETGETQEAQLVRRMDKLDMLVQAFLYEKKYKTRLDPFWEGMASLFENSESEGIFNYLLNNRTKLES